MMLHLAALGGHYKQLNAGRFSKTRNTIYGDTDSLMINTNILEYDDVFSIGRKIMRKINNRYKKVEFDGDIDGVFRYLLLLQKKKYAAVTMSKLPNGQIQLAQEHKGLDIVRRD